MENDLEGLRWRVKDLVTDADEWYTWERSSPDLKWYAVRVLKKLGNWALLTDQQLLEKVKDLVADAKEWYEWDQSSIDIKWYATRILKAFQNWVS
jgi:hypothetical protein